MLVHPEIGRPDLAIELDQAPLFQGVVGGRQGVDLLPEDAQRVRVLTPEVLDIPKTCVGADDLQPLAP